jgi:hypothetical protein
VPQLCRATEGGLTFPGEAGGLAARHRRALRSPEVFSKELRPWGRAGRNCRSDPRGWQDVKPGSDSTCPRRRLVMGTIVLKLGCKETI